MPLVPFRIRAQRGFAIETHLPLVCRTGSWPIESYLVLGSVVTTDCACGHGDCIIGQAFTPLHKMRVVRSALEDSEIL